MVTATQARQLLSHHGTVQPQQASEWTGKFPLPASVERFYLEVGPVDITIKCYGNPFYLPRLAGLWELQAGYRWHGFTGERLKDWDDDWLVVADEGGDPFILSRSTGSVLYSLHGIGRWEPGEIFPDLNTMAGCLAQLGIVAATAGPEFTDADSLIRPEHRMKALAGLERLLGSTIEAESVLETFGWG